MRKIFLATAASATVLLALMAIPAVAGASIHRHAVPSRFGFLQHVKHVNVNSLPANERKKALAVARSIRAQRPGAMHKAHAAASYQEYIGSYYGYLDYNYWDDDLYYDGYYTYGYYYNYDAYGDWYYTYTYWIFFPQYDEVVLYGD